VITSLSGGLSKGNSGALCGPAPTFLKRLHLSDSSTQEDREGHTMDYVARFYRLVFIFVLFFVTACGDDDKKGWDIPAPPRTGVDPIPGSYSFTPRGCFRVAEDVTTGIKFVIFSSDCLRFDTIEVRQGGFSNTWGEIGGTQCPTDAYAISGSFISPTRAEGIIKYGVTDCQTAPEASFVAEQP
jgi:hypothetical protein